MSVSLTSELPRILIVDDEEAILETMTFTFLDDYEVLTSNNAAHALELLDVGVLGADDLDVRAGLARALGEAFGEQLRSARGRGDHDEHPRHARKLLTAFAKSLGSGACASISSKPTRAACNSWREAATATSGGA